MISPIRHSTLVLLLALVFFVGAVFTVAVGLLFSPEVAELHVTVNNDHDVSCFVSMDNRLDEIPCAVTDDSEQ